MSSIEFGSSILSFLAVMAALGLFLWLLAHYRHRFLGSSPGLSGGMQIASELQVGLRQRLVLVRIDDRSMLLAVTAESVQLLSQWNEPAQEDKVCEMR